MNKNSQMQTQNIIQTCINYVKTNIIYVFIPILLTNLLLTFDDPIQPY